MPCGQRIAFEVIIQVGGEPRWQVKPEGIERVLVNGEVIVERGALTDALPGRVLRVGNPKA